jgi:hypothetical protein
MLALVSDLQNTEGWANSGSIAERIWPQYTQDADGLVHARMSVSQRLGWMRRESGVVEKHDKIRFLWRLTDVGESFVRAKVNAATRQRFVAASDQDLLAMMSLLGECYAGVDVQTEWLLRREWQFRTGRR